MTVAVITDSASALPPEVATSFGITVVPIWIEIDGRSVPDGSVPAAEVVGKGRVTTSGPSPGQFGDAIANALTTADAAVVLTVTSGVSGTFGAARIGAAPFDGRVAVIDTGSAAGGEALVVIEAARAAAEGLPLDEVTTRAATVMGRVRVVGALAGLAQLARGGRVPGIAARTAEWLGMRPMFELRHGRVRPLRPRRGEHDLDRMAALCRAGRPDAGGTLHAVVMHADAGARAAALERRLRPLGADDVVVGPFGPAMEVHTGPGLVGLAWWWES